MPFLSPSPWVARSARSTSHCDLRSPPQHLSPTTPHSTAIFDCCIFASRKYGQYFQYWYKLLQTTTTWHAAFWIFRSNSSSKVIESHEGGACTGQLSCQDLRLTCKELNVKVTGYYGRRFCNTMRFDFEIDDLRDIQQASTGDLAQYIKTFVICVPSFYHNEDCSELQSDISGNSWLCERPMDSKIPPLLRRHIDDQFLDSILDGTRGEFPCPLLRRFSMLTQFRIAHLSLHEYSVAH